MTVINEFSLSTAGNDVEYVELKGIAATALTGLWLIGVEGDGSPAGVVDNAIDLSSLGVLDARGYALLEAAANTFENGSITLLLVQGFTGTVGTDYDAGNDGTLDSTPWTAILDSVAVFDGGATDFVYSTTVLDAAFDDQTVVSAFAPGGASRLNGTVDGQDTGSAGDWVRNDFDLRGIAGSAGTPEPGEAINTPGRPNAAGSRELPKINEFVADHIGTDTNEFLEVSGTPFADYTDYVVLQVEGDAGATLGVIDSINQVGTLDANGLWTSAFLGNVVENGTVSLLLVREASVGQFTVGTDLDANDDGTIDFPGLFFLDDSVAVSDGGAGDRTYSTVTLSSGYDGVNFRPGGASRIPNGLDSNTQADWVRNDFDLAGIVGFTGTPGEGEALNTPGGLNTVVVPPPATTVSIMAIQGAGHLSALAGQEVTTTGIVTARVSNGFYLQDATGDGNFGTSDGIFVFTSAAPTVSVGDAVRVAATVTEFFPGGNTNGNLSITELTAPSVTVLSSGNGLPASSVLGSAGRLPPNAITDDDGFTSYDPTTDGVDFYESVEGMRVTVPDAVAVSGTNQFNETWVVGDLGANATGLNSRGGITLSETDDNPERIQIQTQDASLQALPGDRLGTITGVVNYAFGNYEILPTGTVGIVEPGGLEAEGPTALVGDADSLSVATFNVENLDPSDGAARFALIASQIVDTLVTPDIIALQEIQDDNGAINDAVTSAAVTAQTLIDAIVAAGGPTYRYIDVAPADDTSGGEPGGNIRVGYLVDESRVTVQSFGQIDPGNAAWTSSRIPLALTVDFAGETVTLVNNHWSSKGGSSPQFGSIQPLVNGSEEQRVQQAQVVNDYVDGLLAVDPAAQIVVLGDLNEFPWEDALDTVVGTAGGGQPVLNDLVLALPAADRFEYEFQGNSQVLDHILVSNSLDSVSAYDPVHVNAFLPVNDPNRSSDHDPAVLLLDLIEPNSAPAFTGPIPDASVVENSNAGTPVAAFGAFDAEGDPLSFRIASGNEAGLFDLVFSPEGDGEVRTASPIDFEASAGIYSLLIEVTDGGFTATEAVTITVTDVNEAPGFVEPLPVEPTVDENQPGGTVVASLGALDPEGDALTFSIVSGDPKNLFDIVFSPDGDAEIVTRVGLDFETSRSWDLVIGVSDGSFATTADVTVRVGDLAENGRTLIGGALTDELAGGDFDDTLNGNGGNDVLVGGRGNDTLDGGDGIDRASYGTAGSGVRVDLGTTLAQNTLGAGFDTIRFVENLTGSGFADTLIGNAASNRIEGLGNNDTLYGLAGNDTLLGGDGNDVIRAGSGNDTADGGAGTDTASYFDQTAAVTVDLAILVGQNTQAAGTDTLTAFENLNGGSGNDTLRGNAGDNVIQGVVGNDLLEGRAGNDELRGGDGNDTLRGGTGNDRIDGGAGTDLASYFDLAVAVRVDLAITTQQDTLGGGLDTIVGAESASGGSGNDVLLGNASANVLSGNGGTDELNGRAGTDTLTGGAGNDRFVFSTASHTAVGAGRDVILDFAAGDLIVLEAIDANTVNGAGDDDFTSIGASFTGVAGQLRYVGGILAGDTNGNAIADFEIRIQNNAALGLASFDL